MVSLAVDISALVNGEQADPSDYITPLEDIKGHAENFLEGSQHADALLIGTGTIDAKAAFEITSTDGVFIPPRMTTAQRNAIASPATGGLVYELVQKQLAYWNGTSWIRLRAFYDEATVRLSRSTGQDLFNATPAIALFNVEDYDTDTMHDLVSNTGRITIFTEGIYTVTAQFLISSLGSGHVLLEILLNGTTVIAAQSATGLVGFAYNPHISLCLNYQFEVNDYIEMRITQTSGSDVEMSNSLSYFAGNLQEPG